MFRTRACSTPHSKYIFFIAQISHMSLRLIWNIFGIFCASIYDRKRCGILLHLFRCLGKQVRLKMLAGSTGAIGGATPSQSDNIGYYIYMKYLKRFTGSRGIEPHLALPQRLPGLPSLQNKLVFVNSWQAQLEQILNQKIFQRRQHR